jgi:hypothetical protein
MLGPLEGLRLALPKGPNRVCVSLPSLEDRKQSNFRNFVFSSMYNSGRCTESTDAVILNAVRRLQNPLYSKFVVMFCECQ